MLLAPGRPRATAPRRRRTRFARRRPAHAEGGFPDAPNGATIGERPAAPRRLAEERSAPIPPLSDPSLAILDRLDHIVWISDIEDARFLWANRAAVEFWGAADLAELCRREPRVSERMRAYLRESHEHLRAVPFGRGEHTVYPDGRAPVRMAFSKSLYPLSCGREAVLVEATPIVVSDPEAVRRLDAVGYAPLVVTTHGLDGMPLSANAFARATFGDGLDFVGLFRDPEAGRRRLERLGRGEALSEDAEAMTLAGPRWFAVEARKVTDPVSGVPAILLCAHDVTARREAERWKDELISVVSHELRTPLTGIRGALDMLAAGLFLEDAATREELLGIAREDVRRLGRMVDDLLDVQRLGAGVLVLAREVTDVADLVERALDFHRPAARSSGVTLSLSAPERPRCDVDPMRIRQVLSNLVSNAIKHSSPGDAVRVEVRSCGAWARVSVMDEGPGIPPSFRGRLFTAFAQADASDCRRVGGTGLGLYIARTLVEQHGGTLSYAPAPGKGALFHFDLPLASLPGAAQGPC